MVDLSQHGGLPSRAQDVTLSVWEWRADGIYFLGATQDTQIRLRYLKAYPDFTDSTSPVLVRNSQEAIAYATAALAAWSRGSPLAERWDDAAADAIEDLVIASPPRAAILAPPAPFPPVPATRRSCTQCSGGSPYQPSPAAIFSGARSACPRGFRFNSSEIRSVMHKSQGSSDFALRYNCNPRPQETHETCPSPSRFCQTTRTESGSNLLYAIGTLTFSGNYVVGGDTLDFTSVADKLPSTQIIQALVDSQNASLGNTSRCKEAGSTYGSPKPTPTPAPN